MGKGKASYSSVTSCGKMNALGGIRAKYLGVDSKNGERGTDVSVDSM